MKACSKLHGESQYVCFQEEFPCPYVHDGRVAALEYMLPSEDAAERFHEYLSRGYRRVDALFYHNCCDGCSSCIPIRLAVRDFTVSRSQKKTLRENEDIEVHILPVPSVTREKVRLYETYVRTKHRSDDDGTDLDPERSLRMIHYGFRHALEMDYYLGERLIGVGIVDEAKNALSSNYFYYDTAHLSRRLGIYSAVQEIMLAKKMKKRYYYLGFYIAETEKMAYKKFFRPNQILRNGRWIRFMGGASAGRENRKTGECR